MGNIIYRKTIRQISPAQHQSVSSQTAALEENERNNSIFLARWLRLPRAEIVLLRSPLLSSALPGWLGDVIWQSQCACLHTAANSHVGLDLCQHLPHCTGPP